MFLYAGRYFSKKINVTYGSYRLVKSKYREIKMEIRKILLLFYFLEMSDTEISEVLGNACCTVYRNRMCSLDFIRDR